MHDLKFIPALHECINDNRISGAVLLRSSKRRFFSARRPVEWANTSLAALGFADHWRKAKFDDSGGVVGHTEVIFCWPATWAFDRTPTCTGPRSGPLRVRIEETVEGVDQSFL
jgi:hypothetical protein